MLTNGFLKNKNKLEVLQKAIMTGIGVTTSKEVIKKAATHLYDDIQKIIKDLISDLEEKGKIKTKEAKILVKELQKKSDVEKEKIYKKLQKDGKHLLKTARDIMLMPVVLAKELKDFADSKNNKLKRKSSMRKKKR